MYKKASEKITSLFIKHNIIKSEETEMYLYCFELLISTVVSISGIVIIACLFKQVFNTLFFFIGFFLCRKTSGGYHAKNHLLCFLFTQSIFLTFMLIVTYVKIDNYFLLSLIISAVAAVVIFIFAPVDVPNKPFSDKERAVYKKRGRILSIIALLVAIPASFFPIAAEKYFYVVCGIFSISVLIFLGSISNLINNLKRKEKSNEKFQ